MATVYHPSGYSLVELLVVIIIVGVLASVTLTSLNNANDVSKTEETKAELQQLAWAIAGNPDQVSHGIRTDFGYVGDVGALPPNLDALVENPGGYSTWDGPYIHDDFYPSPTAAATEYKLDAWGADYDFSGGIQISANAGGSQITQQIAGSADDLLNNSVTLVVLDLDHSPPGDDYKDSVDCVLTYPNGSGSTTSLTGNPDASGFLEYSAIPIGQHLLRLIYVPTGDTLTRYITVMPGHDYYAEVNLPDNLWPEN